MQVMTFVDGGDELRCSGQVLSTNSSALLIHFSGHALEVRPVS